MQVSNLEHLEILDGTERIKGCASYQDLFSLSFGNGTLAIRDTKGEIYRAPFPLPTTFSAVNIPGIAVSGQNTDGNTNTSFFSLAGKGLQNGNEVAVFFSSSSSVLAL